MKKTILIAGSVAFATLLSVTVPSVTSVAYASETAKLELESVQEDKFIGVSDDQLKELGFNDQQIGTYHNNLENPIMIENGFVENNGQSGERGKFTWAVKLIRKAYNLLPASVKAYILAHSSLDTLLSFIENATGTIHDAVYNGCRKIGMNTTVANIVTAAIMTFVF